MSVATAWKELELQERVMLGTNTSASRGSTVGGGSSAGAVGAPASAALGGAADASGGGASVAASGAEGWAALTLVGADGSAPGSCIAASRRHGSQPAPPIQ